MADDYLKFDTRINTSGFKAGISQIIGLFGKLAAAAGVALSVAAVVQFGKEDVRVIADDSYIVDEYTERKVWQEEVAQGLRSKAEYRKRFMGESDTEAAKAIQAMREETPVLTNLLEEPTE